MSAPRFLESYPHWQFCDLMNKVVDEGEFILPSPMPHNKATNLRQRIYTWRKAVHKFAQDHDQTPEDIELYGISRFREWLSISISFPKAPIVSMTFRHEGGSSPLSIYADIITLFGEATPEQKALSNVPAPDIAPSTSARPAPYFTQEVSLFIAANDRSKYNRDGTERKKRALVNLESGPTWRVNNDEAPFWYPGYGNLVEEMARRIDLPFPPREEWITPDDIGKPITPSENSQQ